MGRTTKRSIMSKHTNYMPLECNTAAITVWEGGEEVGKALAGTTIRVQPTHH